MNYNIYINKKKISWETTLAVSEYIKRLSAFCNVKINTGAALNNLKGYSLFLTSDTEEISTITSEEFADKINIMSVHGISNVNILIGYPHEKGCDELFSISSLQLSDEILLIAFTEQLYRAYTINNNITYHK